MAPSYGLDISDQSLKFVQLLPTKDGIKVGKYGERKIPPGIIESGKIKSTTRLEELLFSLRQARTLFGVWEAIRHRRRPIRRRVIL